MTLWELDDLACVSDLACEFDVGKSAVCNWAARRADFPAPLVTLASGPVYSLLQVRAWHATRAHARPES